MINVIASRIHELISEKADCILTLYVSFSISLFSLLVFMACFTILRVRLHIDSNYLEDVIDS